MVTMEINHQSVRPTLHIGQVNRDSTWRTLLISQVNHWTVWRILHIGHLLFNITCIICISTCVCLCPNLNLNLYFTAFPLLGHYGYLSLQSYQRTKSGYPQLVLTIPIGVLILGIGGFRIGDFQNPKKHKSPIQNYQLVILSPIGDFHFFVLYCQYRRSSNAQYVPVCYFVTLKLRIYMECDPVQRYTVYLLCCPSTEIKCIL